MTEGIVEQGRAETCPGPRVRGYVGSWFISLAFTSLAYLLASWTLFSVGGVWAIALFVGAVAAMTSPSWQQATAVSTVLTASGMAFLTPMISGQPVMELPTWAVAVVLAVLSAFGLAALRDRVVDRGFFERTVSALMVLWVLVNLWAPLFAGGVPPSGYGPLQASAIREVPKAGEYVNDDALYRRVFYLMHDGVPYYEAYKQAWLGLKLKPELPSAVSAYRLPTMYWLWNLLPDDAFAIEPLFLAFISVGCVAAAFITGQLAGVRFAPLAATALAAYALGSATTVYMTYIDLPAMSVSLVGIALYVRGSLTKDRNLIWAAAIVMTAAALTREILAYLLVFALIGSSFVPYWRRSRESLPWLVGLAIFAVGYFAHAYEVRNVMHATSTALSYLRGNPSFAFDSLQRFANTIQVGGVVLPLLFGLGVVGGIAASKRVGKQFAIFAVCSIIVPVLVMTKIANPPIDMMGNQVNYWGNLVVPLALALWPVSAILVPSCEPDLGAKDGLAP